MSEESCLFSAPKFGDQGRSRWRIWAPEATFELRPRRRPTSTETRDLLLPHDLPQPLSRPTSTKLSRHRPPASGPPPAHTELIGRYDATAYMSRHRPTGRSRSGHRHPLLLARAQHDPQVLAGLASSDRLSPPRTRQSVAKAIDERADVLIQQSATLAEGCDDPPRYRQRRCVAAARPCQAHRDALEGHHPPEPDADRKTATKVTDRVAASRIANLRELVARTWPARRHCSEHRSGQPEEHDEDALRIWASQRYPARPTEVVAEPMCEWPTINAERPEGRGRRGEAVGWMKQTRPPGKCDAGAQRNQDVSEHQHRRDSLVPQQTAHQARTTKQSAIKARGGAADRQRERGDEQNPDALDEHGKMCCGGRRTGACTGPARCRPCPTQSRGPWNATQRSAWKHGAAPRALLATLLSTS